jgi:hypothetical protein
MDESFWIKNPSDLFAETNFIPCENCSLDRNLNRLTKFVLIVSIIISAVRKSVFPLYIGLFAMILIALYYFLCSSKMRRTEGFSNGVFSNGVFNGTVPIPMGPYGNSQTGLLYEPNNPTYVNSYSLAGSEVSMFKEPQFAYGSGPMLYRSVNDPVDNKSYPSLRSPTTDNPFMNVMPLDYDANPIYQDYPRYEDTTDPSPRQMEIRDSVESNFEKKLWQNEESRLFERLNSQRQFVSQPVGSVPNKQNEFASWLYSSPYGTCKAGSIYAKYGMKYTDETLLCNGFNAAAPTNQGLLNGNLMSSVQK